jgi:hypothetical protein
LAHSEPNAVRAAYNRAEYVEQRKRLAEAWAEYLGQQADAGVTDKSRRA